MSDPNKDLYRYRISLICECQQDVAFGRAMTIATAREVAEREFRNHHGTSAKYVQVLTEVATDHTDGWHYAEESIALHFEFSSALGAALDHATIRHRSEYRGRFPYYYEESDPKSHAALLAALARTSSRVSGRGGGSIKQSAQKLYPHVYRLVKHIAPEALS